jgi:hypothetical protein
VRIQQDERPPMLQHKTSSFRDVFRFARELLQKRAAGPTVAPGQPSHIVWCYLRDETQQSPTLKAAREDRMKLGLHLALTNFYHESG